jgi:diaminobutyrate-2-oxoglutarate transaminase
MTLGALSATANQVFRNAAGVPLNHVKHFPFGCTPRCPGCELGCGEASLDRLRALYQDSSSGVTPPAAFLIETIQAEGGVKVADKAWMEALGRLAKEVGALLIIDDIQVGVGRTGSFFSFDDLDIDPDIICLAKGIGGLGTPLALNLVKPEIDDLWAPGEHTGTFRGQDISFVAGDVALSYFDDDALMQTVQTNSQTMFAAVEPLAERHDDIHVTGKGMIAGVDVGEGTRAKAIVSQCFEKGLLVSACGTGGRVIKVIPPLTIPEADLQQGLNTLVEVVDNVMKMEAAA